MKTHNTHARLVRRLTLIWAALSLVLGACSAETGDDGDGGDGGADVTDGVDVGPDVDGGGDADTSVAPDTDASETTPPDVVDGEDVDSVAPDSADGEDTLDTLDTGPEPPTTPQILVTPSEPTSVDEVRVEVTTESVAPDGEAVSYTITWTRDGGAEQVEGEVLAAEMTARGQTWTARVEPCTPSACGEAASASVTILNTPPVLEHARLSDYALYVDEVVEAWIDPSDAQDADGDVVSFVVRWSSSGGSQLENEGTFDVSSFGWGNGDTLSVDVVPVDETGAEGLPVTLGPFEVHAPATRWEALQPDLTASDGQAGATVYDAAHDRLLHLRGRLVWEADPDERPLRWTRLPALAGPFGAPDVTGSAVILDEDNQRLLVIGAIPLADGSRPDTLRVQSLSLSRRGHERWSTLLVQGSAPVAVDGAVVLRDRAAGRLLIHGGRDGSGQLSSAWHALTIDAPGQEQWSAWSPQGDAPPALTEAFWVMSEDGTQALLIGGERSGSGLDAINDNLWLYDMNTQVFELQDQTFGRQVLGRIHSEPGAAPLFLSVSEGALGLSEVAFDPPLVRSLPIDPAPRDPAAPRLSLNVLVDGRVLVVGDFVGPEGDGVGVHVLDGATGQWEEAFQAGAHAPLSLTDAAALHVDDEDALFVDGGLEDRDRANLWRFDAVSRAWTREPIADDPVRGAPPLRHGASRLLTDDGVVISGGFGLSNDAPLTDTWRLLRDPATGAWRWQEVRFHAFSHKPSSQRGVMWRSGCDSEWLRLSLPTEADGTVTHEHWALLCDPDDPVNCIWLERPTDWAPDFMVGPVSAPMPFNEGALAMTNYTGFSTPGSTLYMWTWHAPACPDGSSTAWDRITTQSPQGSPANRLHASLTASRPETVQGDRRYVLYGGRELYSSALIEDDLWLLSHDISADAFAWQPLDLADAPAPRIGHATAWDHTRSGAFILGGHDNQGQPRGDLWRLALPE